MMCPRGRLVASIHRFAGGTTDRWCQQAKELWKTCVDLCCAQEMCTVRGPSGVAVEPTGADAATGPGDRLEGSTRPGHKRARVDDESDKQSLAEDTERDKEERVMAKYAGFADMVRRMGLGRAWAIAPLVGVSCDTFMTVPSFMTQSSGGTVGIPR